MTKTDASGTSTSTYAALAAGMLVKVVKGCQAREIPKDITLQVVETKELGADYSYAVSVVFKILNGFKAGQTIKWFARHSNRLSDAVVRLNNGNPTNVIEVVRK